MSEPILIVDRAREKSESNSAFAYRVLRDNIMRLRLSPGCVLNEGMLSAELGISRTPVREAIIQLKEENLVEVNPHKSSNVSLINFILVHEGFFARATVDPVAASVVCDGMDGGTAAGLEANLADQEKALRKGGSLHRFFVLDGLFHEILFRAAGMDHIWETVSRITTHYDRLCYFDVLAGSSRLRPVLKEHQELFAALRAQAAARLPGLIKGHLSHFKNLHPFMLEEYRAYFQDM